MSNPLTLQTGVANERCDTHHRKEQQFRFQKVPAYVRVMSLNGKKGSVVRRDVFKAWANWKPAQRLDLGKEEEARFVLDTASIRS
ncbi:hypothetical protein TNCV_202051 [Trichonephila clavipes]|nr:hypothetical protein TNCV_202051 [Trichonephila clavipes]